MFNQEEWPHKAHISQYRNDFFIGSIWRSGLSWIDCNLFISMNVFMLSLTTTSLTIALSIDSVQIRRVANRRPTYLSTANNFFILNHPEYWFHWTDPTLTQLEKLLIICSQVSTISWSTYGSPWRFWNTTRPLRYAGIFQLLFLIRHLYLIGVQIRWRSKKKKTNTHWSYTIVPHWWKNNAMYHSTRFAIFLVT